MAKAGEKVTIFFRRQTAAGALAPGKVVGDFVFNINGAAVVPSAFAEIGPVDSWTEYSVELTMPGPPATFIDIFIFQATGTDVIAPDTFTGVVEVYDNDALAALQLTSVGSVTVAGSANDADYGDVVDGDSWRPQTQTVEVPPSRLAPFGFTDLSDPGWVISGALKDSADGTSIVFPITTIVDPAQRLVTFGWDEFPVGLALASGVEQKRWSFDVQLVNGTTTITGLRGFLTVKWERDS